MPVSPKYSMCARVCVRACAHAHVLNKTDDP